MGLRAVQRQHQQHAVVKSLSGLVKQERGELSVAIPDSIARIAGEAGGAWKPLIEVSLRLP